MRSPKNYDLWEQRSPNSSNRENKSQDLYDPDIIDYSRYYRGFHLGTDNVKTEDRKYGFDGLQVVLDNLQTAILRFIEALRSKALCY